jgi:hypothetical protein
MSIDTVLCLTVFALLMPTMGRYFAGEDLK